MASMRTWIIVVLVAVAGLVGLAVWQDRTPSQRVDAPAYSEGDVVTIEGCLTGAPDGNAFAITPADRTPLTSALTSRDDALTYTYELVGSPDKFRPFAGQVVRVRGRVSNPGGDVNLDRTQETPPAGDAPADAEVKTEMEAEIQVRRLNVESIEQAAGNCPTPAP